MQRGSVARTFHITQWKRRVFSHFLKVNAATERSTAGKNCLNSRNGQPWCMAWLQWSRGDVWYEQWLKVRWCRCWSCLEANSCVWAMQQEVTNRRKWTKPAERSRSWPANLDFPWRPTVGHPCCQNYCAAEEARSRAGHGNAAAAVHLCDGHHQSLACRDAQTCSAAEESCAARRSGNWPGHVADEALAGTLFQMAAARMVHCGLCSHGNSPKNNQIYLYITNSIQQQMFNPLDLGARERPRCCFPKTPVLFTYYLQCITMNSFCQRLLGVVLWSMCLTYAKNVLTSKCRNWNEITKRYCWLATCKFVCHVVKTGWIANYNLFLDCVAIFLMHQCSMYLQFFLF